MKIIFFAAAFYFGGFGLIPIALAASALWAINKVEIRLMPGRSVRRCLMMTISQSTL